jgi:Raf kinase inhibitor-like YbhB/YbcL family protein
MNFWIKNSNQRNKDNDNDNDNYINLKFTCDGPNISPEFIWLPKLGLNDINKQQSTKNENNNYSYVIIVDDPDTIPIKGDITTHFAIANIPQEWNFLPQDFYNILTQKDLEQLLFFKNYQNKYGWTGPCPPSNNGPHRYRFKIFLMNIIIPPRFEHYLDSNSIHLNINNFERNFKDNIITSSEFIMTYERPNV